MLKNNSEISNLKFNLVVILLFTIAYFHRPIFYLFFVDSQEFFQSMVSGMRYEQFYFSYQYEFMKRGFIGSFFDIFDIQKTYEIAFYFTTVLAYALLTLFIIYFNYYLKSVPIVERRAYIIIFLISPFTMLHLGADFGRFDQILLIITLLIILLIKSRIFMYLIPCLFAIGLLIHEAFLFINVPVLLAILFYENTKKSLSRPILIFSTISIISTVILLLLFGGTDQNNIDMIRDQLINYTQKSNVLKYSILVFHNSIIENIKYAMNKLFVLNSLYFIFVVSLLFNLYFRLFLKITNNRNAGIALSVIKYSFLGILPLFIIGIDFYRWFSLMVFNLFIILPYLVHESKAERIYDNFTEKDNLNLRLLTLLFIIGPIGVMNAFPYILKLIIWMNEIKSP